MKIISVWKMDVPALGLKVLTLLFYWAIAAAFPRSSPIFYQNSRSHHVSIHVTLNESLREGRLKQLLRPGFTFSQRTSHISSKLYPLCTSIMNKNLRSMIELISEWWGKVCEIITFYKCSTLFLKITQKCWKWSDKGYFGLCIQIKSVRWWHFKYLCGQKFWDHNFVLAKIKEICVRRQSGSGSLLNFALAQCRGQTKVNIWITFLENSWYIQSILKTAEKCKNFLFWW